MGPDRHDAREAQQPPGPARRPGPEPAATSHPILGPGKVANSKYYPRRQGEGTKLLPPHPPAQRAAGTRACVSQPESLEDLQKTRRIANVHVGPPRLRDAVPALQVENVLRDAGLDGSGDTALAG